MSPALQTALRILALTLAIFLIFLIIWLFYCRCYRRGAVDPGQPIGRPLNHATAEPHRAEGGRFPAFTPKEEGRNEDMPYKVPTGPLRGNLAPARSASQFLQIKQRKQDTPLGGAGDPVVFSDFDPLGTNSTVGTPPDMNAARGSNVVMLSYNSRVQLSTDGASTYTEKDPTTIFPSGAAVDGNAMRWTPVSVAIRCCSTSRKSTASSGSCSFAALVLAAV